MARRHGLQSEILLSLAVVMGTATIVLAALVVKTHEAGVARLRPLAARALLEDARAPTALASSRSPHLHWWAVSPEGRARTRGPHAARIDPGSLELAQEVAARGVPLLRAGLPWEPLRFAAAEDGVVLVARLEPAAPASVVLAVLLADGLVLTAFGVTLLRRRLVRPLQRLAAAARGLADGDLGVRAPAEGPRETWEVANTFNEMSEALEARTGALEKAVSDLRDSNDQLREARVELDRAERLAAVGSLAAGVAHEVGNPMGAMLAFVELAKRDPQLSDVSRGHLARVLEEGQRVRTILRQLLDFSRPPQTQRVPVDLLAVARETAGLVGAQRRYAGIEIQVTGEGDPPPALADRGALGQILLNLLLNALDALVAAEVEAPRVEITVRALASQVRSGDNPSRAAERRHFDSVECVVADNGPGVSDADRERIFDPFYTTKDPGEGTGLGLSNALRFAEELGGRLVLQKPDGPAPVGAVFVLRLPTAPAAAPAAPSVRSHDV